MTVTHHRDQVARHEAGHVAALVMSGVLPRLATADRPEAGLAGRVEIDDVLADLDSRDLDDLAVTEADREIAAIYDHMGAILLGGLAEGTPGWPPEFPIDPDTAPPRCAGDARHLAALARLIGLNEDGWFNLVRQCNVVAGGRRFKHLVWLIGRALECKDVLDADDLRQLLGPRILARYGIPDEENNDGTQAA